MVSSVPVRRSALVLLALCALLALPGCQSLRSWESCPGVYSGVRYYGDQVSELPFDGKAFFTIDLPFTALADTLALPFTSFAEPQFPPGGFAVGCRWADPRRRR